MAEISEWLAREWAQGIGPAIGAMTGSSAQAFGVKRDHPQELPASALIWRQLLDASDESAVWVWLPESIWLAVGRQVLESAGLSGEDGAAADVSEARSTFLEVLQQSLAPIGRSVGGRLSREISLLAGDQRDAIPAGLEWQAVTVRTDLGELGCGWITANHDLVQCLTAAAGSSEPEPEPAPKLPARPGTGRPSRTLDLLMEVELPVGVSFGRAQMRLKDAIKLTTGSIVELNRSVAEPVEIIVNNCVIARGEVVVVEGNYGVRIKEIISRDERLRTLF
ncbi:flagellar motor switch protein FliN [Paludibaculum fermentans]|uniref:flagellar motor switch protein FliN n=1 Tax=Paludibaculum fermentans TaxID=1473598 RepID=UPI003EB733B8